MSALVQLLARLPRVGEATAARLATSIAEQPQDYRDALARAVEAHGAPVPCRTCGDEADGPSIDGDCRCRSLGHDPSRILVVRFPRDRAAVERARVWSGGYHVLRGLLDPIHGVSGEQLTARALLERLRDDTVREVVFGLGGSDRAKTTTTWLAGLMPPSVAVFELSVGVAFGQSLEDAEPEAVAAALQGRREVVE